jgi:rubrerythrin
VDGRYVVDAAEYVDYDGMDMSTDSQGFIEQAIKIELSNVAFYQCCAKHAKSEVVRSLFKRIGKHEAEHLELLCDHLGIDEPEVREEECSDDDSLNMKRAHDREDRAVRMYTRFAEQAPEPRVKEIFSAIAGIEQEHFKLFNIFR